LLALLVAGVGAPSRGDDKPAKPTPADQRVQAALNAVGHLSVHRPECLAVVVAISQVPRGGAMTAAEFRDLDPPVQGAVAATGLIGVKDGTVAIALLRHGFNNGVWIIEEQAVVRRVRDPELDKEQLVGIEDRKRIPGPDENRHEWKSYLYVIVHAHDVPLDAMAKAARGDIQYFQLLEEPGKYRGEIVHIAGRLKQLRAHDAPKVLQNDGIRHFYEAFIESEASRSCRYWVAFTEKPSGAKNLDKLIDQLADKDAKVREAAAKAIEIADVPVTCDGYFFKQTYLESRSKEGKAVRVPLVVARTIVPQRTPSAPLPLSDESSFFSNAVVLVIIGLTLATALVMFLLWYFRKGDRVVQSRIAQARNVHWVEPTDGQTEQPSGVAEPPKT
jgi:hypothetical protein